jgi:hypothetical protein
MKQKQIPDSSMEPENENPMSLAVVPLDKVFPHELIDPRRVENLIKKLNRSEVFTNPPIVVRSNNHYVVLDGATRVSSFKKLGLPHIIVQILKSSDNHSLNTWSHVVRKIDSEKLLTLFKKLTEITIVKSDLTSLQRGLVEDGCLCSIQTADKTIRHIQMEPGFNYLDALNTLSTVYTEAGHVTRTLQRDVDTLLKEFPDFSCLAIFPSYTLKEVLKIVASGKLLPAGITRFIIPGRVMHLNADFEYLKSDRNLEEKNRWLYDLVMERLANDQVRYYAEPVYLMDE